MVSARQCPVCHGTVFRIFDQDVRCAECEAPYGRLAVPPEPHTWTSGMHEHGLYKAHSHEVRADHRGVHRKASGAGSPVIDVSEDAALAVHMVRGHAFPEHWVASHAAIDLEAIHEYQHGHYEHPHTHPWSRPRQGGAK